MNFAVIATGPSLTVEDVEWVKYRLPAVVVSDAYKLAPWADALVSADAAWWKANPDAKDFAGEKYGAVHDFNNVPWVTPMNVGSGLNSGLLGMMIAVEMGATRLSLLGFDMHSPGKHFFGEHPKPLKPTTTALMESFKRQFARYTPKGVEIINCTPGSALTCYPMESIRDYAGLS